MHMEHEATSGNQLPHDSETIRCDLDRPRWLTPHHGTTARVLPSETIPGLFSLAQMVKRFFGDEFFGFAADMMRWQAVIDGMPSSARMDAFICEPIIDGLSRITERCRQADLQFSGALSARALDEVRSSRVTYGDVRARLEALGERMADELRSHYFLQLEREDALAFRDSHSPDDLDFLVAFSEAAFDYDEALKCLALGRSMAAVMHLMRVTEVGLKALSAQLSIDLERYRNWGALLGEMSKAIERMDRQLRPLYKEAQLHIDAVKDAWRNDAMHVSRRYNDVEARIILDATRNLMRNLTKLFR